MIRFLGWRATSALAVLASRTLPRKKLVITAGKVCDFVSMFFNLTKPSIGLSRSNVQLEIDMPNKSGTTVHSHALGRSSRTRRGPYGEGVAVAHCPAIHGNRGGREYRSEG